MSITLPNQQLAANPATVAGQTVRFSEVIAAMSAALDLTEGQPAGHAARTCILGMRLAEAIGLGSANRSSLYYALLLKDLGCSSNAAKISYLFGADDRVVKRDVKTVDWSRMKDNVQFAARQARPDGKPWERIMQLATMALQGSGATRQLIKTRCERGATIARELSFPESTVEAIRQLGTAKGIPMACAGRKSRYMREFSGWPNRRKSSRGNMAWRPRVTWLLNGRGVGSIHS